MHSPNGWISEAQFCRPCYTRPLPQAGLPPAPHAVMCRLLMTSLFLCLWLVQKGQGSVGETLEELHTQFAVSLYQTLTETDNNSSLIISPASVSMSLGLLQFGARGNTLYQLEGALRYNSNEMRMQDFLQQVQGDPSNSTQALRVQLACALFVQSGMKLSQEFTQHASAWANSSVVHTNFNLPNHTRGQVEQWVRSRGNAGDADALLPGEELAGLVEAQGDPSGWGQTQMALVSSVAFRGSWQRQFLFTETKSLPFTLSDGTTIKVPMMYQGSEVNFGQFRTPSDHRYTVVELSYLGDSLSLMVALPSERKLPLAHLEMQLTSRAVALWANGLRRTKMDVFLPRFKIQNRFNLKSVLLSLGISDIFDPMAADFGGISAEDGLYVSEAIHEAKIEVTEEGTKAAAATAMLLLKRSRAPVFKADRPFLFLLRESSTGSVLFMGRVVNPAAL
ncbi:hypothetical protein SKAU_G00260370 [Synaphobranchus kaupii]|uniref:Serpin domain-containing protein n=1 Tax=Synaphobranchus kaupii TaxID=118154 RepID=A0A9Q1F4K0_SYNKA|nr:hypothetical protein SKAU_G00260370 [Synaphobranchus kaupii]